MAHEDLMRTTGSRISNSKSSTVTVYIPQTVYEIMEEYKNERGMFMGRFVKQVIKAYMEDELIVKSVMFNPVLDNVFKKIPKTFLLDGESMDFVRTISNITGLPQSRIIAKCLTHAVEELKAGVPFGSTVNTDPAMWGRITRPSVDKFDADGYNHD